MMQLRGMGAVVAAAAVAALAVPTPASASLPFGLPSAAASVISPGTSSGSGASAVGTAVRHTFNVLPGLADATDEGAVRAHRSMSLAVVLRRPHPAAEKAFIAAAHNPASPSYRHFLTPARFDARFGVAPGAVAAARRYLTAGGATVDRVSAAGDILSVRGPAAAVSRLFHTAIHAYRYQGHRFIANTVAPTFPKALAITNVVGLNTLTHAMVPHRAAGGATRAQDSCGTLAGTCLGNTTPTDLWSVYQRRNLRGTGQQLAVLGEGATSAVVSDLRVFERRHGLPRIPVAIRHPKGDHGFGDTSGATEWDIDTQASTAMASRASKLTLYFGHDLSDQDVARVFSQFTDDPKGPRQASASYGECEAIPVVSDLVSQVPGLGSLPVGVGLGNALDGTLDQITRQAAAEGKTVFVSSGDTGSSCPVVAAPVVGAGNGVLNQGVPVTNSPASLPYVTAVGGTVLYTDGHGHRAREYGWAFSGGGSTLFTPEPGYQKGVAGDSIPCVSDPSVICRGISDVAAQSGDALTNGFGIISGGAAATGGGTSLSAPLMQGMWADVQSGAPSAAGFGFANYPLYRAGKHAPARSFFDVSSMDTSSGLPATNGLYATAPGWDYVTGWGTPKIAGLACYLTKAAC